MSKQATVSGIFGLATLLGEGALQVSDYHNVYLSWVLAVTSTAFFAWGVYLWALEKLRRRRGETPIQSPRMPLIELYRAAADRGWNFSGENGHVFDMANGLRQAAADGMLLFSGTKMHRIAALTDYGFYEEIPREYWRTCSISAISPLSLNSNTGQATGLTDDNVKTEAYNPAGGYDRLVYCDLQVNREQALRWLDGEAKNYRGHSRAYS